MLPYTLHQHNLWSSCFHTHCTNTIYGAHTSIHIAPTQFMELMLPYTLYQHILWSSCFHTHCTNTFYGAHASIYIAPTRFATLIPLCAIPTMCPLYPQSTYLNVYLAISLPEILYIHRISSDFPAKNTVHTPYIWRFPCQNYCTYTVYLAISLPELLYIHRRIQKRSSGRHVKFLGGSPQRTTHPPYPPNTAPPGTKRVPICFCSNSASICIKRKYNKCVCKTL
jgi:hypothetical protein